MLSRPSCGWCGMKGVFSQEPQPSTPTLIAFSPRVLSEQYLLLRSCSALLRALNTESAQYIHIGLPWWLPSKESVCSAGDSGSIPRLGGSTGEGKATHSSILAWEIPWTEEPDGLQFMGSQELDTT